MSDITSEIPANDAMPCRAKLFIKLFVSGWPPKERERERTSFFMYAAISWD